MKIICALLVMHVATCFVFSQAPEIEWQNTIGGSEIDNLISSQQTSDGGYILGGNSLSGISGDKSQITFGGNDYWVIKLNSSGSIEWQKDFGGTEDDELQSVSPTTDGGFIVGGYSNSGISGNKSQPSKGGYDYWIIKLNSAGEIEWQKTIGGNNYDQLYAIQQTSDNGYVLGGASLSNISGDKNSPKYGQFDYWLVKLDNVGNILWQKTFGGTGQDYLLSLAQNTDNGYILGGFSFSGASGNKTEGSKGNADYWVIRLNSVGDIIWQNTIGGSANDNIRSVEQTTDGGFIAAGDSESGISPDKSEVSMGEDYWIIKLTGSGTIAWQNTIGGEEGDFPTSVHQTTDGGYIVGGFSDSHISGDKTEASVGADYWIIKLNTTGEIIWQSTIGGEFGDALNAADQTADGGYFLAGTSYSNIFGDKTEFSQGYADFWFIKLFADPGCIPEVCNSLDDNCNGLIDDGIVETISIAAAGPVTFCQGESVTLNATYSGTSVQWQKNAVNISGATASSYTATTKGTYTSVTSSACGSASSLPIMVNILKNPTATITAGGPTTFCAGGSVTLTETPSAGCSYQWYKGASALAGATSTNYIATTVGNYKCRVTKTATGCYKNSNTIMVSVPCRDGDAIISDDNAFSIYPNPNNGTFTITSALSAPPRSLRLSAAAGETEDFSIMIDNSLGQQIYSQPLNTTNGEINETINLGNIPAGIYYVRLNSGNNFLVHKLIIK